MNVREIITDYLKANGYDGLCTIGCGCGIDNLAPCDCCNIDECIPAHKKVCNGDNCEHYQSCDVGLDIGDTCFCAEEATNESQD